MIMTGIRFLLSVLLAFLTEPSFAQKTEDYPIKPVRIVMSGPPDGLL